MFILLIEFNVLSIRIKHKTFQRKVVVNVFNSKFNSIQIFIIFFKIFFTAFNLQKDYFDIIFINVSLNAQLDQ